MGQRCTLNLTSKQMKNKIYIKYIYIYYIMGDEVDSSNDAPIGIIIGIIILVISTIFIYLWVTKSSFFCSSEGESCTESDHCCSGEDLYCIDETCSTMSLIPLLDTDVTTITTCYGIWDNVDDCTKECGGGLQMQELTISSIKPESGNYELINDPILCSSNEISTKSIECNTDDCINCVDFDCTGGYELKSNPSEITGEPSQEQCCKEPENCRTKEIECDSTYQKRIDGYDSTIIPQSRSQDGNEICCEDTDCSSYILQEDEDGISDGYMCNTVSQSTGSGESPRHIIVSYSPLSMYVPVEWSDNELSRGAIQGLKDRGFCEDTSEGTSTCNELWCKMGMEGGLDPDDPVADDEQGCFISKLQAMPGDDYPGTLGGDIDSTSLYDITTLTFTGTKEDWLSKCKGECDKNPQCNGITFTYNEDEKVAGCIGHTNVSGVIIQTVTPPPTATTYGSNFIENCKGVAPQYIQGQEDSDQFCRSFLEIDGHRGTVGAAAKLYNTLMNRSKSVCYKKESYECPAGRPIKENSSQISGWGVEQCCTISVNP